MDATSKTKAVATGAGIATVGFINWLTTVSPSQQADWLGQLTQIVPETWKPNVGLFSRLLMFGLTIYGFYQAAHSGPQTPPKNPPSQ